MDFNDYHQQAGPEAGPEAVKTCIEAAEKPADPNPGKNNSDVTDVTGVTPNNGAASSCNVTKKADVTDVTAAGYSGSNFIILDNPGPLPNKKPIRRAGVYRVETKEDSSKEYKWICSPLHVDAVTHDPQEGNFGRLLRFKNTLGRWRSWAMPMELLAGDGIAVRAELMAMGVEIDPKRKNDLALYIQGEHPARRIHCALQVGWNNDSYVLPDKVIGEQAADVIFQSGERGHDEHTTGGTLEGWQKGIAVPAIGNPLLILAISASFAGPLLAKVNAEGGGFHFQGDSSTGKSTLLNAACATWGGTNYKRSWRTTANGMEGCAALFNDCLLALDEISECDPREVGTIVYSLGNGTGKQRASRSGSARSVTRWRCFVLSSGERTIGTTMAEGGHRVKAGQAVRLLDIQVARQHGAFDVLHETKSGAAFSDSLKYAATIHHGHAGRAFLEKLTRDTSNFGELLERVKNLPAFAATDDEGQEKRAAGRFALVAMAGERATEYGLTGWPEGEALDAAVIAFDAWRNSRGRGNNERRQVLEKVSGFIECHGDSRFSDADKDFDIKIINRAGWFRDDADGHRVYLFTADGMREAIRGFEFKRALDLLQEAGVLPPAGATGERARAERIGGRRPVKLYSIDAEHLGGADNGA